LNKPTRSATIYHVIKNLDTDVAVVGLGPVGGALALLLARQGRRVTVLERQPHPYARPRAVHLDNSAARIVQACGLGETLRANSHATNVYEWRNATGVTLLRLQNQQQSTEGWPSSNMVHQPTIESALFDAIDASPLIAVHRDTKVIGFADTGDGVDVATVNGDGEHASFRAHYVVGCDGANSVVREQLDVPTEDLGYFFDWLIVDVVLNEPRVFEPDNLQVCDPLRPTSVVSGGPGRRRWEFMCLPGEDVNAMNDEAMAWKLLAAWDVRPDNAHLERHTVYRFQARWVEEWRVGRVLLAGDSAHLMPPFAGQGLCSGLRDAMNVAWKIDHALRHENEAAVLDSYRDEREPHVRAAIGLSVELGKIICVPDPEAARMRDEQMAPMAAAQGPTSPPPAPPMTEGFIAAGSPTAGRTFPQSRVQHAGREVWSDDLIGVRWALVSAVDGDDRLDMSFLDGSGPVSVNDVDGTIVGWMREQNVAHVAVRPDRIVFGSAETPEGLAQLITDRRAALAR
jgi:2-polyprenyl-6-methoxyphenol hydroxylase-like FAD-dependent oxidoreductase